MLAFIDYFCRESSLNKYVMKTRTVIKVVLSFLVILLCVGFALYFFFRLTAADRQKDLDLFSVIPPSAAAVLVVDDASMFVDNWEHLTEGGDSHSLRTSRLLADLRDYLHTLNEGEAHGVSSRLNQIMLSCHAPYTNLDQVLYCHVGEFDREVFERFIASRAFREYPPKILKYRGEEIYVYPTEDGGFLAAYLQSDFSAISYEARLLKEVVDVHLSGKSLKADAAFQKASRRRKAVGETLFYVNWKQWAGWVAFQLKMQNGFIYLSGMEAAKNEMGKQFVDMVGRKEPISGFSREWLPASTFQFMRCSVSDWQLWLDIQQGLTEARSEVSPFTETDSLFGNFLANRADDEVLFCRMATSDSLHTTATVLNWKLFDAEESEHSWKTLWNVRAELGRPVLHRLPSSGRTVECYRLPAGRFYAAILHTTSSEAEAHVCFYRNRLLMSSSLQGLLDYADSLETNNLFGEDGDYAKGIAQLSDASHFLMMARLEDVFEQSDRGQTLLPEIFEHYMYFFRHFSLYVQASHVDGIIYPELVLHYHKQP